MLETVHKKRFAKMDPQVLAEAWKVSFQAHAKDPTVTPQSLESTGLSGGRNQQGTAVAAEPTD